MDEFRHQKRHLEGQEESNEDDEIIYKIEVSVEEASGSWWLSGTSCIGSRWYPNLWDFYYNILRTLGCSKLGSDIQMSSVRLCVRLIFVSILDIL